MICTAVPTEAVDIVWKDVSLMLAKAVDTSKGKFHIQDLYKDLLDGKYNLWLILDDKGDDKVIAAITTRIINYPNRNAMAMDWFVGYPSDSNIFIFCDTAKFFALFAMITSFSF